MRALTLREPYATLVAWGEKRFETRTYRASPGPLAIHAAKHLTADVRVMLTANPAGLDPADWAIRRAFHVRRVAGETGMGYLEHCACGRVLCTVEVVACHAIVAEDVCGEPTIGWREGGSFRVATDREDAFGDWRPGRWAWELGSLRRFVNPQPAPGRRGFWDWEGDADAPVHPTER